MESNTAENIYIITYLSTELFTKGPSTEINYKIKREQKRSIHFATGRMAGGHNLVGLVFFFAVEVFS